MQPAPYRAPINAAGPVAPEWLRWFQQLQSSGGTVEIIGGALSALGSEIASANAAITALAAKLGQWRPLALLANNRPTGDQTRLNLLGGANITLADDGRGNVTIESGGEGLGVALSTNGVRNGLQTALNLRQGAHIALTDDGAGAVTVAVALPATHSEPLTDGNGNLITSAGDVIEAVGVPN